MSLRGLKKHDDMAYTYLLYHIVIRPKASQPVITEAHEKDLYAYIWGICKEKNCRLHRINGMPDHLHLLVEIHQTMAVADFVRELKISSNTWMKQHSAEFPHFDSWGKSYCALTYSLQDKDKVMGYIKGQKEHHKTVSFKDEYESLLKDFGIEPDQWMFKD